MLVLESKDPDAVKLIDFGLARGPTPENRDLWPTWGLPREGLGTPFFMPPETWGRRDQGAGNDVWA